MMASNSLEYIDMMISGIIMFQISLILSILYKMVRYIARIIPFKIM